LAGAGGLGAPPGRIVPSPLDSLIIRWNTHNINIGWFRPKARDHSGLSRPEGT
jgi:hypothetical protein